MRVPAADDKVLNYLYGIFLINYLYGILHQSMYNHYRHQYPQGLSKKVVVSCTYIYKNMLNNNVDIDPIYYILLTISWSSLASYDLYIFMSDRFSSLYLSI